jgi:hypothetical protein
MYGDMLLTLGLPVKSLNEWMKEGKNCGYRTSTANQGFIADLSVAGMFVRESRTCEDEISWPECTHLYRQVGHRHTGRNGMARRWSKCLVLSCAF